jgi:hypothetical protein
MTKRFDTKDPAEIVTAEFDYSAIADTIGTPAISISARVGTDPGAAAMLLGAPVVLGAKVLQRIQAGLDDVDYSIRCLVPIGTDTVLIDAVLPVRTRPTA